MKKALVTGSAGFIGFHVSRALLQKGYEVLGVDGLTDYYDVKLKKARNSLLKKSSNRFSFSNEAIENKSKVERIFKQFNPEIVIHLAAQAGVRYSIDCPSSYMSSNLQGTFNILEALRHSECKHFLMASTSSVYGSNPNMPYRENANTDNQMSFYAATKKSNEVMSHSYSHLFRVPTTCFRFFTVYGPWGRPDMALFKFTEKILAGNKIDVYNNGKMKRDFTYIDDLVYAITKLIKVVPSLNSESVKIKEDSISPVAPWRVVNIGSANPVELEEFLQVLEDKLKVKIKKNYLPIQPGDVPSTSADITLLEKLIGPLQKTSISDGIEKFLDWYKSHYKM